MERSIVVFCTLSSLCVALSYIAADMYLPAFPVIQAFFSTSISVIQSTMAIYMIGIATAQLLLGPIIEYFGYRKCAIFLSFWFGIGSIICISQSSLFVFDFGRFIQALSAGGLTVIGRASFFYYLPKNKASNLYIAIVPTVACISPALAPVAGGLLTHHISWQSIFILLALLGGAIFLGICFYFPCDKNARNSSSEFNIRIIFLSYVRFFSNREFLSYICIVIFMFMIYYSYMVEVPFIFHRLFYSTRAIGFSFITIALAFFIASHAARILLKSYSNCLVINLGFLIVIFGLCLLMILTKTTSPKMYSILFPATIYLGGIGMINPVAISSSISLFPKKTAYASGVIGTSGLVGAAFGSAYVHIFTQISVFELAAYSLFITCVCWLLFMSLQPKVSFKN